MGSIEYTVTDDDGKRSVKEILRNKLLFSSRLLRKIKFSGKVFLNEKNAKLTEKAIPGDVVKACYPDEESPFEPEDIAVDTVYEDEDLLICDKPAGLIVHPTKNFQRGTLANAVTAIMIKKGETFRPRFVNRIDMNTSGLVTIAKNARCQDFLSNEMKAGLFEKTYIAIAHGSPPKNSGIVDSPIGKDPTHPARRIVKENGYPSRTLYEVLKTFPPSDADFQGFDGIAYSKGPAEKQKKVEPIRGYSLLLLKLETGRTHQIRVHMASMGCPLLGDELYGEIFGYGSFAPEMPRQALHASKISFRHPVTLKTVTVKAGLPQDMKLWLQNQMPSEPPPKNEKSRAPF